MLQLEQHVTSCMLQLDGTPPANTFAIPRNTRMRELHHMVKKIKKVFYRDISGKSNTYLTQISKLLEGFLVLKS